MLRNPGWARCSPISQKQVGTAMSVVIVLLALLVVIVTKGRLGLRRHQ
jgi:hypothetical protein